MHSRFSAGDMAGANAASQSAKSWSIAGLAFGIVLWIIGTIILIIYVSLIAVVAVGVNAAFDNSVFDNY